MRPQLIKANTNVLGRRLMGSWTTWQASRRGRPATRQPDTRNYNHETHPTQGRGRHPRGHNMQAAVDDYAVLTNSRVVCHDYLRIQRQASAPNQRMPLRRLGMPRETTLITSSICRVHVLRSP
jgi:hypothetical protein